MSRKNDKGAAPCHFNLPDHYSQGIFGVFLYITATQKSVTVVNQKKTFGSVLLIPMQLNEGFSFSQFILISNVTLSSRTVSPYLSCLYQQPIIPWRALKITLYKRDSWLASSRLSNITGAPLASSWETTGDEQPAADSSNKTCLNQSNQINLTKFTQKSEKIFLATVKLNFPLSSTFRRNFSNTRNDLQTPHKVASKADFLWAGHAFLRPWEG